MQGTWRTCGSLALSYIWSYDVISPTCCRFILFFRVQLMLGQQIAVDEVWVSFSCACWYVCNYYCKDYTLSMARAFEHNHHTYCYPSQVSLSECFSHPIYLLHRLHERKTIVPTCGYLHTGTFFFFFSYSSFFSLSLSLSLSDHPAAKNLKPWTQYIDQITHHIVCMLLCLSSISTGSSTLPLASLTAILFVCQKVPGHQFRRGSDRSIQLLRDKRLYQYPRLK